MCDNTSQATIICAEINYLLFCPLSTHYLSNHRDTYFRNGTNRVFCLCKTAYNRNVYVRESLINDHNKNEMCVFAYMK